MWWAPRVFPRDEGPSGEVVTAVAYVCTSGEHKGHGWVWRHGTEGLWFLVSMNQQCHTASPTALSLMSIQSIPNRAPFIATFCCMGRDNSLQYSPQLKKNKKHLRWFCLNGDWRGCEEGLPVLKRCLFKDPPHINSRAPLSNSNKLFGGTHGIMFSKRLMVLVNRGLDLRERKKIH